MSTVGNGLTEQPVVVLGFGAAGINAVLALREAGYAGAITVVSDAEPEPYSPVLTSYYAGGRASLDQCRVWSDLDLDRLSYSMHAHTKVAEIDVDAHEVVLDDGNRIGYSKLLVATGAHPVAPGFPQVADFQPLMLRTMDDAERLRRALASSECEKFLVSGTSMVGLKVVESCLDRGVRVTLLGRSPHIMRNSAHPVVAERFAALLAERGVALRLAQTIAHAKACELGGCTISFSSGDEERFDHVVLAQGVEPNLDFVSAGIEIDKGLLVDEFMRTSAPDVFAAGDVAQALDVSTGGRRIVGLWQNAVHQGRCAGHAMAAELEGLIPKLPFPGSLPCNTIHVRDILFASVGVLEETEGRQFEVSEAGGSLQVLAFDGSGSERRLVGANVLSVVSAKGGSDSLDREIGGYRREILNGYLR